MNITYEKAYEVSRFPDGRVRATVRSQSENKPLDHVVRHSPTGFEFGYGGSGPADLALSILVDHFGSVEAAEPWYQLFKWDFLANKTSGCRDFVIYSADIRTWVRNRTANLN